jgi:hypothetical protein
MGKDILNRHEFAPSFLLLCVLLLSVLLLCVFSVVRWLAAVH